MANFSSFGLDRFAVRRSTRSQKSASETSRRGDAGGDIHQVANAHDDRVSISIYVYGADIGAVHRHIYPAAGGCQALHLGLCQ